MAGILVTCCRKGFDIRPYLLRLYFLYTTLKLSCCISESNTRRNIITRSESIALSSNLKIIAWYYISCTYNSNYVNYSLSLSTSSDKWSCESDVNLWGELRTADSKPLQNNHRGVVLSLATSKPIPSSNSNTVMLINLADILQNRSSRSVMSIWNIHEENNKLWLAITC